MIVALLNNAEKRFGLLRFFDFLLYKFIAGFLQDLKQLLKIQYAIFYKLFQLVVSSLKSEIGQSKLELTVAMHCDPFFAHPG